MDKFQLHELDELKRQLLQIGVSIPGTMRETYHRCGKPYCQCMSSEQHRHGPYFLWDRKVDGKLSAKSIPLEDVPLYKEWIENRHRLEKIVARILDFGNRYATQWQDAKKTDPQKLQKTSRRTRGK